MHLHRHTLATGSGGREPIEDGINNAVRPTDVRNTKPGKISARILRECCRPNRVRAPRPVVPVIDIAPDDIGILPDFGRVVRRPFVATSWPVLRILRQSEVREFYASNTLRCHSIKEIGEKQIANVSTVGIVRL